MLFFGTMLYIAEPVDTTTLPTYIYWCTVTVTTVGTCTLALRRASRSYPQRAHVETPAESLHLRLPFVIGTAGIFIQKASPWGPGFVWLYIYIYIFFVNIIQYYKVVYSQRQRQMYICMSIYTYYIYTGINECFAP